MRVISSQGQAALDSGRFGVRCLLKVTLDASTFCIWDDVGDITISGDTYTGAAGRFTVTPSTSVSDLSVRNLDVTLSGLDAEVVALIDGEQWHQRPILIQRAVFAIDTPQTLHVMPEFSGFLDQMIWRERIDGTTTVMFRCESASREYARSSARTRSDADQRQRDSSDGFFKNAVSAVTTQIDWGRSPEQPRPRGGIAGLIDRIF